MEPVLGRWGCQCKRNCFSSFIVLISSSFSFSQLQLLSAFTLAGLGSVAQGCPLARMADEVSQGCGKQLCPLMSAQDSMIIRNGSCAVQLSSSTANFSAMAVIIAFALGIIVTLVVQWLLSRCRPVPDVTEPEPELPEAQGIPQPQGIPAPEVVREAVRNVIVREEVRIQVTPQVLYVTRTGNRFHILQNCRGLENAHEVFARTPCHHTNCCNGRA